MKGLIQIAAALWLAFAALALAAAPGADLTVFAAASLADALRRIGEDFEERGGAKVAFNFAASSTLARQIAEGAPADLFFSADEAQMNSLERNGLLLPGTRTNRLGNSLVIVVPADSSLIFTSATNLAESAVRHIALADPRAVPAGVYAEKYLNRLHLWTAIEPKVVPTANVRAALAAVESGNVEAGMVYKTDAAISKKVKVALEIPPDEGPRIEYPMAVLKDSHQPEAAKSFLSYLESDRAAQVFKKYGFVILN